MLQANDTFQLVLSTDGKRSFAAFIFNAPQVFTPYLTRPGDPDDFDVGAGFFGARSTGEFADVEAFLIDSDLSLPPFSLYRIDGILLPSHI